MRIHHWLLTLALGLGLGLILLPTQAAEKADPARIARLIEKMGSSDFEEREQATQELDGIGLPALAALRKAMESDDAEVRRRAEELVTAIEKRTEGKLLLAPTRIRLAFDNTPLPEAVAELGRKSGYRIVLDDPEGKLKDRTVTLDTGETTFWQAFDLFCARASLVEARAEAPGQVPPGIRPPLPGVRIRPGIQKIQPIQGKPVQVKPIQVQPARPLPIRRGQVPQAQPVPQAEDGDAPVESPARRPAQPVQDEGPKVEEEQPAQPPAQPVPARRIRLQAAPIQIGRPGGAIQLPQGVPVGPGGVVIGPRGARVGQPDTIVLTAGKPETLPTDYSSAIRVRANPKAEGLNRAAPGQILIGLEATPEPKLQWQRLIGVHIDRAVDENGQELEHLMGDTPAVGAPAVGAAPIQRIILPGQPFPGGAFPFAGQGGGVIPVHLKQGDKPSKVIAELKGTLSAELLAPAEELISVDGLAKAAGKTFKGKDGSTLKIIGMTDDGKGNYQIRLDMSTLPGAGGVGFAPGGIQIMPLPAPVPLPAPAPVPLPPQRAPRQNAPAAPPPGAFQAQAPVQVQVQGQAQVQVQIQIQGGPNGVVIMQQGFPGTVPGNGLKVVDDKGNVLEQQGISTSIRRNPQGGLQREQVMRVKAAPGQGAPAKLVYTSRKSVTVDIPFTLKNVAIP